MLCFSKRSPQIPRGARRDGGGGAGDDGWGGSCWRRRPLGDSLMCRWVPVKSRTKRRRESISVHEVTGLCHGTFIHSNSKNLNF